MDVTICDVGPRDGLQNEPDVLAPEVRADLVSRLAAAGLPRIEAVSFVRDDRVPQMAGAEQVGAAALGGNAELSGLVLNEQGYDRVAATSLGRVNCTRAAADEFKRRNGYAAAWAALDGGATVLDASVGGLGGCPFSPSATGNIATEDLVWQLQRDGIETGANVDALVETAVWLAGKLGHDLDGLLHRAAR